MVLTASISPTSGHSVARSTARPGVGAVQLTCERRAIDAVEREHVLAGRPLRPHREVLDQEAAADAAEQLRRHLEADDEPRQIGVGQVRWQPVLGHHPGDRQQPERAGADVRRFGGAAVDRNAGEQPVDGGDRRRLQQVSVRRRSGPSRTAHRAGQG